MRDSLARKLALAALTVWPLIYMACFFLFIFGAFMMAAQGSKAGAGAGFPAGFKLLFLFHCGTIVEMMALAAYYIVHAIRNPALKQDMRIIWVILILMGGIIAMPIYWYLYIWRSPQTKPEKQEQEERNAL